MIQEQPRTRVISNHAVRLNHWTDPNAPIPAICIQIFSESIYYLDESCNPPLKMTPKPFPNPRVDGVRLVEWSYNSKYLATMDGM